MKKIAYLFSATAMVALATLSSCKKDEEPTPDPAPEAPVATVVMTTSNGGNTGTAIKSLDVTTATGTAKIRLDVTSTEDIDKIYIMKSQDNGTSEKVAVSSIVTTDGKTFTGGDDTYSLKVPSNMQSFVIDIAFPVRTSSSAVTDVYTIWITRGNGDFLIPAKRRILGNAVVTFKYTAAAPAYTFTQFSGTVGDQQNTVDPSFIVTSGSGGVIGQADYKNATTPENARSVDISFASTNGSGTALGTTASLASPSIRSSTPGLGFSTSNEPSGADVNTTVFGTWTGTAFASATAAEINTGVTGLTAEYVNIVSDGTYSFITDAGKKGLIKVGTITTASGGKKFSFTIKVLN